MRINKSLKQTIQKYQIYKMYLPFSYIILHKTGMLQELLNIEIK